MPAVVTICHHLAKLFPCKVIDGDGRGKMGGGGGGGGGGRAAQAGGGGGRGGGAPLREEGEGCPQGTPYAHGKRLIVEEQGLPGSL